MSYGSTVKPYLLEYTGHIHKFFCWSNIPLSVSILSPDLAAETVVLEEQGHCTTEQLPGKVPAEGAR